MKDLFDSLVRTYVPWIVGVVIGWLVSLGVELDAAVEGSLTVVVTGVVTALYYLAARLLETYVSPKFGWLLGSKKAPTYDVIE